jgi:putative hemolysin
MTKTEESLSMKNRLLILQMTLTISVLILGACAYDVGSGVGLPNPAAVYCQSQGHTYDIRTDAGGGQYGVCLFADGTECGGWDYYRGHCHPGDQPVAQGDAANLVAQAGLEETTEIQVFEPAEDLPGMFVYRMTIANPALIDRLVDALDADLSLADTHEEHPAHYRLAFHLTDGSVQTFDYSCQMATPAFLHGEQAFWQGRVAIAPDSFNLLIAEQLATAPKPDCTEIDAVVMHAEKGLVAN